MFSGIVACVGAIRARQAHEGGLRIDVEAAGLGGEPFAAGESIAVNGVCLTVVMAHDSDFSADVSGETLRLSMLGALEAGCAVNLERALRMGDRLGGHLVSGHVDGVGTVRAIESDALSKIFRFDAPEPLRRFIAIKGSIAVDGVSLTVNAVDESGFSVNLIPHTLSHTTLGGLSPGDPVNLEVDQIARYAERLLAFLPYRA